MFTITGGNNLKKPFPIRLLGGWRCSRTFIPQPPRALVSSLQIRYFVQQGRSKALRVEGQINTLLYELEGKDINLDLRPRSWSKEKVTPGPSRASPSEMSTRRNAKSRHLSHFYALRNQLPDNSGNPCSYYSSGRLP